MLAGFDIPVVRRFARAVLGLFDDDRLDEDVAAGFDLASRG